MKIGQLAERSGLSAHTIRYYERIGLLPIADRDTSGQRNFDSSILVWIGFLQRLKTTGMPIKDMLNYSRLRAQGDSTNAARCTLLRSHRDKVKAHLATLQDALIILDNKIKSYE